MEAEHVVNLFDSIWFENLFFQRHPPKSILKTDPVQKIPEINSKREFSKLPSIHVRSKSDQLSSTTPFYDSDQKTPEINSKTELSKLPSIHVRSKSDQLSSITPFSDSFSPNSVLFSPQSQTIFSKKEAEIETDNKTKQRRRRKTEKGKTKSLTDLEFEELKGFMDLGFVFSEDDANSSLAEILPGLQRLGEKETDIGREIVKSNENLVQRPYLSEAWKGLEKKENINPLINWEIKDLVSEVDVKQRLKCWAHSVASAVR